MPNWDQTIMRHRTMGADVRRLAKRVADLGADLAPACRFVSKHPELASVELDWTSGVIVASKSDT